MTLVLFALASFFALREFITLTPSRPGDRLPLSLSFFLVLPLQFVLIGMGRYGMFAIFIPVYAFLLLPSIAALRSDIEDFLSRSAKQQWGLMVTVYCLSHAPALLMLEIPGQAGRSALLLFYLLLVVQMSDVMQYVFGKLFGTTKIAPLVSPSKTVEGFIGGGLAATAIGAAMWWITPFTPLQSAAISAVIVHHGVPRRADAVRGQAQPRRQGLGRDDRRPRRHAGPHGFHLFRRAGVLSHRAVLLPVALRASAVALRRVPAPAARLDRQSATETGERPLAPMTR